MSFATFVISTGRCGTQWLAAHLADLKAPGFTVEHEPLGHDNHARKMLGVSDPSHLPPELATPILAHADQIERTLEAGHYIECGHPCWSSLPWLANRFQGRFRVIHLVRHPVPTAYSWLTHQAYCPPLAPYLPAKILLAPSDAGVLFPEYQERWPTMTPFEKALYYWTEVNAAGLKWEQSLGVPWLRISYEGLFGGDDLAAVHDFLGLGAPDSVPNKAKRVDQFNYVATGMENWNIIANHPHTLETARSLGCDPLSVDTPALVQRYVYGQFTSSSPS